MAVMSNAVRLIVVLCFVQNGFSWTPNPNKFNCGINKPCIQYFRDLGQYHFAYDGSDTQFVQCDVTGGCFVKPCASGTVWSTAAYTCIHGNSNGVTTTTTKKPTTSTYKFVPNLGKFNCDSNKPCTQYFRKRNQYYFAYDGSNAQYVQCDQWGGCYLMPCAPGTVWSSADYTCVQGTPDHVITTKKPTPTPGKFVPDLGKYNCSRNKPCTQYFRDRGQYYFASDASDSQFIQCDQWGGCFLMPCGGGTVWKTETYTCDHA